MYRYTPNRSQYIDILIQPGYIDGTDKNFRHSASLMYKYQRNWMPQMECHLRESVRCSRAREIPPMAMSDDETSTRQPDYRLSFPSYRLSNQIIEYHCRLCHQSAIGKHFMKYHHF